MTRHARTGTTIRDDGTTINMADVGVQIRDKIDDLSVVTFNGQTINDPVGEAGFLQLHEAPDGTMKPSSIDASGRVSITLEGVPVDIGNFPAEFPLPASQVQTNALTDSELRASPLDIGNFPEEFPLPASQVQTDALTDAELRAVPVDVRARNDDDTQYVNPRSENGHGSTPADPTHITGAFSSTIQDAADSGAVFIAGGRETLSPGDVYSLSATNPAGSGFIVRIFLITAYTSDNDSLRVSFILNPTVDSGTTRAAVNFRTSDQATPSVLTVQSGVNNLTGGEASSVATEITRRDHFNFTGPPSLVVEPDQVVAMTITAPGGLTGSRRASGNIAWVIEPI